MSYYPVNPNRQVSQPQSAQQVLSSTALNIALLGYRSHPHVGGQGIYIHYLSKALADLGHKVEVISGPPYPELDARVRLIQLPSLDLYANKNPTRALRPRHLLSLTDFYEWWSKLSGSFAEPYTFGRRLVKHFKARQPRYDIVHDNQSLCYGLLQLQQKNYTVVATVHHPITRDRDLALLAAQDWGHRWLIKRWYNFLSMQQNVVQRLAHITTVSKQSQQDIVAAFQRPAEKIHVIPNGIDTEIFKPIAEIGRNPWRIITTASSDQPIKGLSILLNALAVVREQFPLVNLVVVGKLKEGGATEAELKKLQLENCVEFISGISTEQLVREYASAKFAVVPSLYEGFGLPAGEALACGVPLICSDGGALPEVVGNSAYSVKAGDLEDMSRALAELLGNDLLCSQLGSAGRAHSLQHLSWQVVAEQLITYYRGCISASKKLPC
ncbi:MAG TPA: glycosyltransferase family 4 protein [Cellvibrio sp.]|nr:glycosyltransferase family 4 protein [Cellvibrio sp.]